MLIFINFFPNGLLQTAIQCPEIEIYSVGLLKETFKSLRASWFCVNTEKAKTTTKTKV